LRLLLARALNRNQLLILSKMVYNDGSISSFLSRLSEAHGVPLSSLKLNSRILQDLGLIKVSKSRDSFGSAALSEEGRFVMEIMNYDA